MDNNEYKGLTDVFYKYLGVRSLDLVRQFHLAFSHPIADVPTIPPYGTIKFRVDFIIEEVQELLKEYSEYSAKLLNDEDTLIGIADALGDIQYVLDGFFLNAGLHNYKDAIIAEIHASNMSKLCVSEDEAQRTIDKLTTFEESKEFNQVFHYAQVADHWVVYRSSDNKVMKGINYFKPDLKKVIYGTASTDTRNEAGNNPSS